MSLVGLNVGAGKESSAEICVLPIPEDSTDYLELVKQFSGGADYSVTPAGNAAYLRVTGPNACLQALKITQDIIWALDRRNLLQSPSERYHIRIGIAAGLDAAGSGRKVITSASIFAKEAKQEQVLVDSVFAGQGIADFMLKTEPAVRSFPKVYSLSLQRLLKAVPAEVGMDGLVALYPDRITLRHDLTPARLLWMAAPKSEVMVAGRTLISWTRLADELGFQAKRKNLKYRFLTSSLASCSILGDDEFQEVQRDYNPAKRAFERMVTELHAAIEVKETEQAVIDGRHAFTSYCPERPTNGSDR